MHECFEDEMFSFGLLFLGLELRLGVGVCGLWNGSEYNNDIIWRFGGIGWNGRIWRKRDGMRARNNGRTTYVKTH